MLENETGTIVEIHKNLATIRMVPGSQCSHCGAQTICTTLGDSARILQVPVQNDMTVGDTVRVHFKSASRVEATIIVFVVPIFFMLAGLVAGLLISPENEGPVILSTFARLVVGFFTTWVLNKLFGNRSEFQPDVQKIISQGQANVLHINKRQNIK